MARIFSHSTDVKTKYLISNNNDKNRVVDLEHFPARHGSVKVPNCTLNVQIYLSFSQSAYIEIIRICITEYLHLILPTIILLVTSLQT